VTIEVMVRVTFIVGVAVLAVEPVVPHSDISSLLAVAELDTADAALEAADVVEEAEALDDHGCAAA